MKREIEPEIVDEPYFFLLESTLQTANSGWSVATWDPKEVVTSRERPDILSVIGQSLRKKRQGIWIGYLGYEYYARLIDKVPPRRSDLIPEAVFCYYEDFHLPPSPSLIRRGSEGEVGQITSNFTKPDYLSAIRKIKNYIAAGDCYQVNLSQRFTAPLNEAAWELYRRLCRVSPAPYAAYLNLGGAQILSSSPECFLQVDGRQVVSRPIKGTRPRGATLVEDARLREELITSPKDRAELLMITDLVRNDLGRVCEPGSVSVSKLCQAESYAQVHHLVSTVQGTLREGCDTTDLLRATFPGGSITGAPKIRAMQIIRELETAPRNVYTGAIGMIRPDGSATFNIAIRTMILKEGKVYFSAGGGIVADSDPETEYEESTFKAEGMKGSLFKSTPCG